MNSYSVENWTDLYVAVMGSAAALTGLLFVSISVNLDRIIKLGGAPERGLETLVVMLGVILLSIRILIPQGDGALTSGVLLVGASQIIAVSLLQRRRHRLTEARFRGRLFAFNAFTNQLPGVLVLIGGISLEASSGGGMYWLSAAMVAAMITFFANAWILLVEIVR